MLRRFGSVFSIAAAIGLALLADEPLGAQGTLPTSAITQPINDSVLVTLSGNPVPLATLANDRVRCPTALL
jgi:hypothetical protein